LNVKQLLQLYWIGLAILNKFKYDDDVIYVIYVETKEEMQSIFVY